MKKFYKYLIVVLLLFFFPVGVFAQTFLEEGFDNDNIPEDWEEIEVENGGSWETNKGGYEWEGESYPDSAYEGDYNAFFFSTEKRIRKLVTPALDLSEAKKVEVEFAHAMYKWWSEVDELRVYYKENKESSWTLLKEFVQETEQWQIRTIQLPDTTYTSDYKLAFEATSIAGGGAGVCIDEVKVVETASIPKKLESVSFHQASEAVIPAGSSDNPILRIDFEVSGNSGELFLDSLSATSLNTNDADLEADGVKLYATHTDIFSDKNPIGQAVSFENSAAVFDNLNYSLPYGVTSIWLTYDTRKNISYESHLNILDAKFESNSIKVSNSTYPYSSKSPDGIRRLQESLIYDDFADADNWSLSGEFEIAVPQGKGSTGSYGYFSPDPDSNTVSGINVLGTDLTGLGVYEGDYEPGLSGREYYAVSKTIDCKYYENISLNYYRWLNIHYLDKASIDLIVNEVDTVEIWSSNESSYNNDNWGTERLDISEYTTRTSDVKVAYSLGPTDNDDQYGGWNIDDFSVTGDYIAQDVGVSVWVSPRDDAGLSDKEQVKVAVKNYGGEVITQPVPLAFSVDGGKTMHYDTIKEKTIPVDDSITFTFGLTADFSDPGLYEVMAETTLGEDEDKDNDRLTTTLFSYPTETLPYSDDFEQNDGYWYSQGGGIWEHGKPDGNDINSAASGENVWMTRLSNSYPVSDSSFIESPAFDFTDVIKPVFEMAISGNVQAGTDGMKLQYSLDGESWHDVDSATHSNWKWYNSYVEALASPGWSESTGWQTVRQFLPDAVTGESSVKLRLLFQSGGYFSDDDGYAIDDVSVYESPVDVGIDTVLSPVTQCELSDNEFIRLAVKNFGVRAISKGEALSLKVEFDNETTIADTFLLADTLNVGDTLIHTLTEPVDMSEAKDYEITAYTTAEDNPALYGDPSNDTAQTTVSVLGMPDYSLAPNIGTDAPDTVILDAGAGYNEYNWHDGGPADQFYNISAHGTYSVTVTNAKECTATDSISVIPSNTDIGVVDVYNLSSSCEYAELQSIEIAVENFGEETKLSGEEFPLGYTINEDTPVLDTLVLTEDMAPGDTVYFTFDGVDLSEPMVYNFQLYTGYDGDINMKNDTLSESIEVYGYPEVELGVDSIFTSRADTFELNAGKGFDTYEWQDGSTDSIYNVTSKVNDLYYVTVTDVHGCGEASDSVRIIADDFAATNLLSPVNSCQLDAQEYPEIELTNQSQNTYPANTRLVTGYKLDGDGSEFKTDTILLSEELGADSSYVHEFSTPVDMSEPGDYNLISYVDYSPDIEHANDTLQQSVSVYGYPEVDLGYDTIYTTRPDTITLNAGSGFKQYEWQDGSTDSIFEITDAWSKTYSVAVTAFHGCGIARDTVVVVANDLSVSELVAPESDCSLSEEEEIKVEISNSGNDTLVPGETINTNFVLDGGQPVQNIIELSDTLFPSAHILHTFEEKIDLSSGDSHELKVYLDYGEYSDVQLHNDTLQSEIFSYGYPEFTIGNYNDTIITTSPDTLQFGIEEEFVSYQWQDGTMGNTYNVSSPVSKEYSVTVSDAHGCTSVDSVFVSAYDLGIDTIFKPRSACELSDGETIEAELRNYGADTLLKNKTISVGYQIDNQTPFEYSLTLQDTLFPDSALRFSYEQTADFSDKELYELAAYTDFNGDANTENDAFISEVDVYGPDLELGPDTNVQSPTYEIDAGSGFQSYEWHDGSTGQTFLADANDDYEFYAVTVTNNMDCSASDTVHVWFDIAPHIAVTEIFKPESGCRQEDALPVVVEVENKGELSIPEGTEMQIMYLVGENDTVAESMAFNSEFQTGNAMEYEFDKKVSLDQDKTYQLSSFVDLLNYDDMKSDTAYKEVDIHYPEPYLAGSDTLILEEDDFPYYLSVGNEFSSVEWHNGSGKNTFEVTDYGKYWVTVTDSYGCVGSDTVVIAGEEEETGVDGINTAKYDIQLYPNPVSHMLNVKIRTGEMVNFKISLVSSAGMEYYLDEFKAVGEHVKNVPVSRYEAGFYYLKIQSSEQIHVLPVIIK